MFQESLPMSLWIVLPVWGCRTLGGKKRYKHTLRLEGAQWSVWAPPAFRELNHEFQGSSCTSKCCLSREGPRECWTPAQGGNFYLSWEGHHSEASLVASYSLLWPFCCLTDIPAFVFHYFLLVDLRSFPTSWVLTARFTLHIIKPFQIVFQKSHP